MVLRRGQLVGIADDEPDGVGAPERQGDTEDREETGVAGEDVRRGTEGHEQPGKDEERRDHPGGALYAEGDRQRAAAAGAVAFDIAEILRRSRAEEEEHEDRADEPRLRG